MQTQASVAMPATSDGPVLIPRPAFEAAPSASEYAILKAVIRAASAFLLNSGLIDSLDTLLAGIGEATGASRAYVFKNDPPDRQTARPQDRNNDRIPAGAPLTATQIAEWTAPGITPQIDTPAVRNMSMEATGFEPWAAAFEAGTPFVATSSHLPEPARSHLLSMGIQTLAVVPVVVDGQYWGFIGIDNCVSARLWSEVEVEALAAAAVVLAAAVRRRRYEETLEAATTQARLAADIGEVVTREGGTLQEMLDLCCAAIARHLDPDLIRIWMMSENLDCLTACSAAGVRTIQHLHEDPLALVSPELMRIAASKEPTYWDDGIPELWPGSAAEISAAGLRAGVAFPLITNGRVNGVAVLLGRVLPSKAVIEALESITDEVALAIERFHAQGAATRAEQRYRRLVTATVEGIVIHDGRSVIDANPSFSQMIGWSPEEILQMNPFQFIPEDYHDFVKQQLAAHNEQPYEIEGLHKDGRRFPVELKGSELNVDGRMLRVAAIRDISDRKKVQQTAELLREEQQARALAEKTRAQAEFLADASRILASSLDTTTTLTQLAHLAIPMLADYCVVSVVEEDTVRRVAIVHRDPEQEPLLRAAVNAWPEKFPDDHPIFSVLMKGTHFIAREVDDALIARIAVANEYREYLRRLAPRSILGIPIVSGGQTMGSIIFSSTRPDRLYGDDDVALATEFAHRAALALQAARSYHAAQAAAQSRDEMLAVVAHDLRNPLNTIFMGSELALEVFGEGAPPVGLRQLQTIRRSADHMNKLIQDLLDASRMDSGNLALERAALAPADLLRAAAEMMGPLAAHQKIEFTIDAADELPILHADQSRLLQVLSNLVGNALKFTPAGGSIVVGAAAQDGAVTFQVTDTGAGIPAEQISQVFNRFWQARRTDRRGIGLGLAIASGIVEAHGGKIWVESRVGAGTTFRFTVPVGRAEGA